MRLNGVLEGKCYMAAQKAAFIVSGRICGGTWAFISVMVPSVKLGRKDALFLVFMGILECFMWYWKGVMVERLPGAFFYGVL